MKAPSKSDLYIVVGLAIAAALVFIPGLGSAGMFDPTDSFFIEAAREMLQKHEFVVPLINYDQWLDKPAFAFWLIIASYKCFGINEFAGRLPSALCGMAVVVVTYMLSRRILTARQALLSSLTLLSLPLFVVVGHVSLTDEPLCLLLTTALLSFANRMITGSLLLLILAYVALGLAILCKGPMALALVGLVVLVYLMVRGPKNALRSILDLHPIMGVLILAAIVVPYYLSAHNFTHGEFTKTFFLRQNLGRIAGNLNHIRPFWFYIPILLAGMFPWSILLAFSSQSTFGIARRTASRCQPTARQKLLLFTLCWATLGFLVFSSVPTKLETYIVPILPAISIIAGCYLDAVLRARAAIPLAVTASAMLIASVGTPIALIKFLHAEHMPSTISYSTCTAIALAMIASLIMIRRSAIKAALSTICSATVLSCAIFIPLLFYLYHGREQESIDRLAAYAKERGANLAIVRYELPSLIYRYECKIPEIQDQLSMRQFAEASDAPQWVFVHHDVLSLLSWTERSPRVVAYEGKWWLFAIGRNCRQERTVEWLGLDHGPYPTLTQLLKQ